MGKENLKAGAETAPALNKETASANEVTVNNPETLLSGSGENATADPEQQPGAEKAEAEKAEAEKAEAEKAEAEKAEAEKAKNLKSAKLVKIKFLLSPTGRFNLGYNVGDVAKFEEKQANEIVDAAYAEFVK